MSVLLPCFYALGQQDTDFVADYIRKDVRQSIVSHFAVADTLAKVCDLAR